MVTKTRFCENYTGLDQRCHSSNREVAIDVVECEFVDNNKGIDLVFFGGGGWLGVRNCLFSKTKDRAIHIQGGGLLTFPELRSEIERNRFDDNAADVDGPRVWKWKCCKNNVHS